MDSWARYGAASGVVAVVLFGVGFFLIPEPPDPDAPAAEVAAYFAEDHGSIQVGAAFIAAATLPLLWFVGTLTSVLRRAEGGPRLSSIAFGAGVITIGLLIADLTAWAVAALRPENMQAAPELAQALNDFSLLVIGLGAFVFAGFFLAVGLVTLRHQALPAWLGWLALVAALAVGLRIGSAVTTDGVFSYDGVLGFYAGLVAFAAWTLIASIHLLDQLGKDEPSGGGPLGAVTGVVDRVRGGLGQPPR